MGSVCTHDSTVSGEHLGQCRHQGFPHALQEWVQVLAREVFPATAGCGIGGPNDDGFCVLGVLDEQLGRCVLLFEPKIKLQDAENCIESVGGEVYG